MPVDQSHYIISLIFNGKLDASEGLYFLKKIINLQFGTFESHTYLLHPVMTIVRGLCSFLDWVSICIDSSINFITY